MFEDFKCFLHDKISTERSLFVAKQFSNQIINARSILELEFRVRGTYIAPNGQPSVTVFLILFAFFFKVRLVDSSKFVDLATDTIFWPPSKRFKI